MQFRDLARQYQTLRTDIDQALLQVAADAHYIQGPQVRELEQALASYVGTTHCLTCANGTDALLLALKVWGIGPGDAVFVPDFTFFSTAEVVATVGATPVFVDVDAATFNLSAASLQQAVEAVLAQGTLRPRVVIAVDLFGLPADYAAIRSVADAFGLYVLEDGAQGFGGRVGERRACSLGDISTTSFFPAKPLGCYGDGGAVFTDNAEWAALLASYRVHGKGTDKYDNVRIGMNSRLDTLQAAVLSVKLRAFAHYELDRVNAVAAAYSRRLQGKLPTPQVPEGYLSSWAQYTVLMPSEAERTRVQQVLREQGIPTMVYYPRTMHAQTAFAHVAQPLDCEAFAATQLCQRVLSLPMHPYLTDEEVDTVASALIAAL